MLDIKITRTTCPKEKPQDESKLGFGKKFTDHMFVMDYTDSINEQMRKTFFHISLRFIEYNS